MLPELAPGAGSWSTLAGRIVVGAWSSDFPVGSQSERANRKRQTLNLLGVKKYVPAGRAGGQCLGPLCPEMAF